MESPQARTRNWNRDQDQDQIHYEAVVAVASNGLGDKSGVPTDCERQFECWGDGRSQSHTEVKMHIHDGNRMESSLASKNASTVTQQRHEAMFVEHTSTSTGVVANAVADGDDVNTVVLRHDLGDQRQMQMPSTSIQEVLTSTRPVKPVLQSSTSQVLEIPSHLNLEFEYTPNLDLRFDIESLVSARKPAPTSAVLADNAYRCSHLEEIELGAATPSKEEQSSEAYGARPHSGMYSVIGANMSCDTLDTLGTFGFPEKRTSQAGSLLHNSLGADATGFWEHSGNFCESKQWSDLLENTGCNESSPASNEVVEERRASGDSEATCVDDNELPKKAGNEVSDEALVDKVEGAPDDSMANPQKSTLENCDAVISPVSIPTLSTPRFALPTPLGSTFSNEDEALACLSPEEVMQPRVARDYRLAPASVKRSSRYHEQNPSPLRVSSSVSDLRHDLDQSTAKQRPVTTIAARNWRSERESARKLLSIAPRPCLRNSTWLRDTLLDICIDQEAFRPVHPLFTLVSVSLKTSEELDKALQEMGVSAEKRILLGGMAEFKPIQRRSYLFSYTSLESSPSLRRITRHGDESHEFISRYASLRVNHFGVYSVSGVEDFKIIAPLKGPHTVQARWRFEYFVHPKRTKQKDGKVKVNLKGGERMIRPLSFSCTPALIEPTNGKKITLLSVMRKNVMPKLTSEKIVPPVPHIPPVPPIASEKGVVVALAYQSDTTKKHSKSLGQKAAAKLVDLCAAERPSSSNEHSARPSRHRRTSSAKICQQLSNAKFALSPKHNRSRSASYTHQPGEPVVVAAKNYTVSDKARMARPILPLELLNQMMNASAVAPVEPCGLPAPPARAEVKS